MKTPNNKLKLKLEDLSKILDDFAVSGNIDSDILSPT